MKYSVSGLASRHYNGEHTQVIQFLQATNVLIGFSLKNLPPLHAMSSIDHLYSQSFHWMEKSARDIMKLTANINENKLMKRSVTIFGSSCHHSTKKKSLEVLVMIYSSPKGLK